MSQIYTDPTREQDAHALPNAEVFYNDTTLPYGLRYEEGLEANEPRPAGWYWWACFPGCLPDSEPCGPFETEQEAIDDAQDC